jgi:hypothetical protein
MPTEQTICDLTPVLLWLHSKKHDEKNPRGEWHRAWECFARLLYEGADEPIRALEKEVHKAFGRVD